MSSHQPLRDPDITQQPAHAGGGGTATNYTTYELRNDADRDAAVADVVRITSNGSIVSRILRVITNHGRSKNFHTITGEDGLTWGIKDFTSGGVLPLMRLIESKFPGELDGAFAELAPAGGAAATVLTKSWLDARTSENTDQGLTKEKNFRIGLDRVLTAPRYRGAQLARFLAEAVTPSRSLHLEKGYQLDFTLAVMTGVANSFGAAGMKNQLEHAIDDAGSNDEEPVVRKLLSNYALRDARTDERRKATRRLLARGFGDEAGSLPGQNELAHSGRRARLLFDEFPWAERVALAADADLGTFNLTAEEALPG